MFKLEKQSDKAVLTIYGYVGGAYLDFRAVNEALDDISKSGYSQLDFHIHTYGGTVFDGNLIYNFLASFKGEVDIYIDGIAASMGSIIIMSGTRIYIAENGFVMIHAPQGGAYGTAKQMVQTSKLLTSMEKNFTEKLVARTGMTEAEVKAWFDGTDYWFDADECIAMKLADDKFSAKVNDIKTFDKSEAEQIGAKAVFDRFAASLNNPNNQIINPKNTEMQKEDLIKRYGLTSVTAQSSDEEVLAAVDAKMKASDDAAKAVTRKAIEASVDSQIAAGKITKEQRDVYIARGEKLGLDDLNAMFADMKPYDPISKHIQGGKGKGTENGGDDTVRANWTWKDYQAKALSELEEMPKKDPEKFKALYKAEFGAEPEL